MSDNSLEIAKALIKKSEEGLKKASKCLDKENIDTLKKFISESLVLAIPVHIQEEKEKEKEEKKGKRLEALETFLTSETVQYAIRGEKGNAETSSTFLMSAIRCTLPSIKSPEERMKALKLLLKDPSFQREKRNAPDLFAQQMLEHVISKLPIELQKEAKEISDIPDNLYNIGKNATIRLGDKNIYLSLNNGSYKKLNSLVDEWKKSSSDLSKMLPYTYVALSSIKSKLPPITSIFNRKATERTQLKLVNTAITLVKDTATEHNIDLPLLENT